jgi:putative methionine-R-sulfoxide reductase with GAF domain
MGKVPAPAADCQRGRRLRRWVTRPVTFDDAGCSATDTSHRSDTETCAAVQLLPSLTCSAAVMLTGGLPGPPGAGPPPSLGDVVPFRHTWWSGSMCHRVRPRRLHHQPGAAFVYLKVSSSVVEPLDFGSRDRSAPMTRDGQRDRPVRDPRDAFGELGRLSFDDTSMEAMLQRIAELAKQVLPAVAEASVSLIEHDKASTAAYTGRLALDLDETQYGRGYGPCLEAAVGEEIVEITDARAETRWPAYAQAAVERGSLSSMSVPLPVREALHGGLNLYAVEASAFDDDARTIATTFASYAAVAVHNMHLYESTRELADNLDLAMRTRAVIEQAKGILMSERRCDATAAFTLLAAASQRSNRKLREIAQAIVDGVTAQNRHNGQQN